MKLKLFFLVVLAFSTANFAFSQNDWEKTPYQNWNKSHISKILNDSPWVKTVSFQQSPVDTRVGTFGGITRPARMVLRSALTVRQALLRQRQLNAGYDKMSDADKKAFDTKNSALVECPACKDYYVVAVSYGDLAMDNKNYVKDRKKYVYLSNESGDRRELIEIVVVSDRENEVFFYFPRRNEKGEDLLTVNSKKLIFNFELKGLDGKSDFPFTETSFDVSKLIKDDKVMF